MNEYIQWRDALLETFDPGLRAKIKEALDEAYERGVEDGEESVSDYD